MAGDLKTIISKQQEQIDFAKTAHEQNREFQTGLSDQLVEIDQTITTEIQTATSEITASIEGSTAETITAIEAAAAEVVSGVDAAIAGLADEVAGGVGLVTGAIAAQTTLLMAADVVPETASLHSIWYRAKSIDEWEEKVYGRLGDVLIGVNDVRTAVRQSNANENVMLEHDTRDYLLQREMNATVFILPIWPFQNRIKTCRRIKGYSYFTVVLFA